MNRIVILTTALCLTACNGTDVGNPVTDIDFQVTNAQLPATSAKQGTTANLRPANGIVQVDGGWVSVTTIRIRHGQECDGEEEINIPAGVAIDLSDPGPIQALEDLDLLGLEICEFRITLDGFSGELPESAPPELAGSAIVLLGSRADDTPFVLASDQDEELNLVARGGGYVVSEETNALIVGFDAIEMLSGLDFDGADVGDNGEILIDPEDNSELLSDFRQNFDDATKLYDDDNGDGELDDDESEDADVLAD